VSAPLNALWVTGEPPSLTLGGGNIRQAHLLRRLAGAAATDLIVVGAGTDPALIGALRTVTELPAPSVRFRGRASRRMHDLGRALAPWAAVERTSGAPYVRLLAPVLATRATYDLVVIEHLWLSALARERRPTERWLLGVQNIHSVTREQALGHLRGRRAWLTRREVAQGRRYEGAAARGFDQVVTVSEHDAAALPYASVVVPNGVDIGRWPVTPIPAAPEVVLTATLSYEPNVDGARWFCDEVWPRVLAGRPDARLSLVGRDPTDVVLELARRTGVRGAWDVPDVLPYLQGARVSVVPLRQGSGTRLKALEALAAGRALVGTSTGLAGLGIVDGVHALVRDDPEDFAAAVLDVLADDELARRLAREGRALAEQFDWSIVGAAFLRAALDG
jgi:glycosyltransferase involved in cell wall biosynthesis